MPLETLISFILASALLALVPGPDNLYVLSQSALHGRRAGLMITLGLCSGLLVHTAAVALGLAAIFQVSSLAFNALKFVGAGYLLYLAWAALRASPLQLGKTGVSARASDWGLYRRGILMNLSNPKVAIFFLAFLPQFTSIGAGPMSLQLMGLGAVFLLVALLIFSLIALLAAGLRPLLQNSPRVQILLNRITGLLFIGLALRLAFSSREF